MEITVRKSQKGDAAAMLEYLKAVGGETDNLLIDSAGVPLTVEQEEQYIERFNSGARRVQLVAVTPDGEIVGISQISAFERGRIAHRGEIALSVRKAYWGQGIGTRMMRELIAFARDVAGVSVISLEVRSDNYRAIALYKKFGFESFGTFRKFFLINGQYHDAEYMNLYL